MSNTLFESGGKSPPLLIIRGQMSSYSLFHRGGNVQGVKCFALLTPCKLEITKLLKSTNELLK